MVSNHTKGVLIGLAAVLCGSPCVLFIRMLDHSNVWTQSLFRTTAQIGAPQAGRVKGCLTPEHLLTS